MRTQPAPAAPATATPTTPAPTSSRHRFFCHYLEMIAVMLVSTMVLGGVFWEILGILGHGDLRHSLGVRAFVMTIHMVIGMTIWMRFRRQGWASTFEMDAAIILPFVLLIGPYWAGMLSGGALIGVEDLLMLPFMFIVMLWRYAEYAQVHQAHSS